jgi:gentisate 1,2-dioxygenase
MLERERVREREAEPIQYDTATQDNIRRTRGAKEILAGLPHVVKYDDRQWTQGISCTHKYMNNQSHESPVADWNLPFHTMNAWHEILRPGKYMGTHRHILEAIFYIQEGKGWEIHDGVRWDWEAGDILCVPTYCIHTHFSDPVVGARFFAVAQRLYDFMGCGGTEQLEIHPNYRDLSEEEQKLLGADEDLQKIMAERHAYPAFQGAPKNTYETYMKKMTDEVQWRQACTHVVKGKDMPWEDTRMGRMKFLVHPKIPTGLITYEAWLQEIPPGGATGKHRHMGEELHLILEGKGHDTHNGVDWEWGEGDIVAIPHNTVHQHFNDDPYKPALSYHVQSRLFDFMGHGGIEHLEDAPK